VGGAIDGLRVLVVEDEALIAMDLGAALRGAGCEVVGPVARPDRALGHVDAGAIDAAVLDINLGGETVFAVADALARREVPFVFVTGYDRGALPERLRDRPLLGKPYSARSVLALLGEAVGRRPGPQPPFPAPRQRPQAAAVRRASGARSS
jgi:CheY-like chemotaxis protein